MELLISQPHNLMRSMLLEKKKKNSEKQETHSYFCVRLFLLINGHCLYENEISAGNLVFLSMIPASDNPLI